MDDQLTINLVTKLENKILIQKLLLLILIFEQIFLQITNQLSFLYLDVLTVYYVCISLQIEI